MITGIIERVSGVFEGVWRSWNRYLGFLKEVPGIIEGVSGVFEGVWVIMQSFHVPLNGFQALLKEFQGSLKQFIDPSRT